MNKTEAILFVCLGNICRSPMAEGICRTLAEQKGITVEIDSAGTGSWHVGEAPDARAQRTVARHGGDISMLTARQVTQDDFYRFTHIIALDHNNLSELRRIAPADASAKLSLLLDHVKGREGQAVADPYYGSAGGFETTWNDVLTGTDALLDNLANTE